MGGLDLFKTFGNSEQAASQDSRFHTSKDEGLSSEGFWCLLGNVLTNNIYMLKFVLARFLVLTAQLGFNPPARCGLVSNCNYIIFHLTCWNISNLSIAARGLPRAHKVAADRERESYPKTIGFLKSTSTPV